MTRPFARRHGTQRRARSPNRREPRRQTPATPRIQHPIPGPAHRSCPRSNWVLIRPRSCRPSPAAQPRLSVPRKHLGQRSTLIGDAPKPDESAPHAPARSDISVDVRTTLQRECGGYAQRSRIHPTNPWDDTRLGSSESAGRTPRSLSPDSSGPRSLRGVGDRRLDDGGPRQHIPAVPARSIEQHEQRNRREHPLHRVPDERARETERTQPNPSVLGL